MMANNNVITEAEIRADIAGFQKRLDTANAKLAALAVNKGKLNRYKLKLARKRLLADIEHIRKLITIAEGALKDRERASNG